MSWRRTAITHLNGYFFVSAHDAAGCLCMYCVWGCRQPTFECIYILMRNANCARVQMADRLMGFDGVSFAGKTNMDFGNRTKL